MRFAEARKIINHWCMLIDGKAASTNKNSFPKPNAEALNPAWWHENSSKTPDWQNPRTIAYLAAYLELAGPSIPMKGIKVWEGFIYPDRAVMRALEQAECVRVDNGYFTVTPKGEALVAPWLVPSGPFFERVANAEQKDV